MTDEYITVKPPWPLHGDAARILMRIYPDTDSAHDLTESLEPDNAAVVAVRNAGRAYLSSVQVMLELEALIAQYRQDGRTVQPGYFMALGEVVEEVVQQEIERGARAIQIMLPKRTGAPYTMARGLRGITLLELFLKAQKGRR